MKPLGLRIDSLMKGFQLHRNRAVLPEIPMKHCDTFQGRRSELPLSVTLLHRESNEAKPPCAPRFHDGDASFIGIRDKTE
jgi:hypothetical protein